MSSGASSQRLAWYRREIVPGARITEAWPLLRPHSEPRAGKLALDVDADLGRKWGRRSVYRPLPQKIWAPAKQKYHVDSSPVVVRFLEQILQNQG